MENKLLNVLIIDDHPLITNAYKSAFDYVVELDQSLKFNTFDAYNCDNALQVINDFISKNKFFDIIFLDISLPASSDGKILSGEDLGVQIKLLIPNVKILVSTTFSDNYRIRSIFKSLNPDGFLIKNDVDPKELVTAIITIISDPPYYSKTVVKLLRNEVSSDIILDSIDRKLLYELSIGTRMKDLPEILLLSLPAVEKRKSRIKQIFDIVSPYDKELLSIAREKGFI